MGPQSPGYQTRGHSTGHSPENTTLETQEMREGRGPKKCHQDQAVGSFFPSGTEFGSKSTARPWGHLPFFFFFDSRVPTIPAMVFLALCYGISPGGILLHTNSPAILVSSAGPEAKFSSPVFPSCLAWKNSKLVKEKQAMADFRE